MSDTTFIYGLTDPVTGAVEYIGKSDNPQERYKRHLYEAQTWGKSARDRWIAGLVKNNKWPGLVIVEKCNKENWREREDYWIGVYLRGGETKNTARRKGSYIRSPNRWR